MTSDDWIAAGTVALATFTLALAIATVGLIWDQRRARREAADTRTRSLFRHALVEQLENCRKWSVNNPWRGKEAVRRMLSVEPRFVALESLLGEIDLPTDVAARMIWTIEEVRDVDVKAQEQLANEARLNNLTVAVGGQTYWHMELDYLQT